MALPAWARELVVLYESHACSQFILSGNVSDRIVLPLPDGPSIRHLDDFIREVLLRRFDVVLRYDIGNGIRVERGEALFAQWPTGRELGALPKSPRDAIETLTRYFRYCANLHRLQGGRAPQVGCVIHAADLVVPALQGGFSVDLGALALLIRDWSSEDLLWEIPLATFLVCENENDLHPLLVQNPRAAHIALPLPSSEDLHRAFSCFAEAYPLALRELRKDPEAAAKQLAGTRLAALESLLRTREYTEEPLTTADVSELKKSLVERDCNGLIEFVASDSSLDDYVGQDAVREWLRADMKLWSRGELEAMPMGYLLCGPVGTGKTHLVTCLAGEAGVPVVELANFRDRWVGSTESNLERIFRLIRALGRCIVFVDEADQALGRRDAGGGDAGISGRVYSMIADEMSDTRNRGRVIWILASSRPDLIEVDLKRPGRVDVKLPLLPTASPEEGFELIRRLCARRGLEIAEADFSRLAPQVPGLLTPGAAEALVVKVFRTTRLEGLSAIDALERGLAGYRNPVRSEVLEAQIRLAVDEATDPSLVPARFRPGTVSV